MSHIISYLNVKNFKSIKEESFELANYTALVGYNNAGKSNIIESLQWLLKKTVLQESQFNNNEEPVEIIGKISGISTEILESLPTNHRASIERFINNGELFIRRTQPTPSCPTGQIKLDVSLPTENIDEFEWESNPNGIDQAMQSLFPDPIHIGAMEDAGEDVSKNKNTTTIGKLLAEIIEPFQTIYQTTVEEALSGIKNLLDSESTLRAEELIQFDNDVNVKIETFFPGINLKVHIPTPEIKEVFSKGTIKIFETDALQGKDISSFGHGAQRSVQMALIRHLADVRRANNNSVTNTLLLIDEPELYLHPQAIEVLRDALKQLSTEGFQVIFSTHSPFMITSKDVENTLLIRKNNDRGTHKRNSLKTAISTVFAANPSQLGIVFSISNSSQILFAEKVILVEGKTENKLLPAIIKKITGKTVGLHKTAFVPMDGCTNTKKTMEVLEVMDIPTKCIVDFDFVCKEGIKQGFLDGSDVDVLACKTKLAELAATHSIRLDGGWPTKKQSTMTASEAFALLVQDPSIQTNLGSLKIKMNAKNIYFWYKGDIEKHLNNIEKDEGSWANFIESLERDNIDVCLPNDHEEFNNLITWLFN